MPKTSTTATIKVDVSEKILEVFAEVGERLHKLEKTVEGKAPGRLAVVCAELQEQVGELTAQAEAADILYDAHTDRIEKLERAIVAEATLTVLDEPEEREYHLWNDKYSKDFLDALAYFAANGGVIVDTSHEQDEPEGTTPPRTGWASEEFHRCRTDFDYWFRNYAAPAVASKKAGADEPRTVDSQGWDVPEPREYRVGDCVRLISTPSLPEEDGVIVEIDPVQKYIHVRLPKYVVTVPGAIRYADPTDILCRLVPEDGYDAK